MPYNRRSVSKMADIDIGEDLVSVVDVYDIASDIGKECEIMIDKFGADAVTALLPKVINALEHLENLAVRNEKENSALQELSTKISQLENDKVEKAEYRQRFEKELESIEEQWSMESAELVSAVSRLQDENKRLRRTVNSSRTAGDGDSASAPPSPAREQDAEVLQRLASTAEKQRNTLREQEHSLQEKQQIIDSLTTQVDHLTAVSRELRRKQKQLHTQMRVVCEERSELDALVQTHQKELAVVQQNKGNEHCARCTLLSEEGSSEESERPMFSTRELRAILHERNDLKQRLQDVEEMLAALRHDADSPDTSSSYGPVSIGVEEEAEEERGDAPVQGPLPCEPDDAPWKRRQRPQGGIRKFFRKLFAESDVTVGSFPKRSFSSLASKMATGTIVTSTTTT